MYFVVYIVVHEAARPPKDRMELRGDAYLALDQAVYHGKLDNGLTYYVRDNASPRKTAELRLIVKIGSLVETESQRGFAHFIEHMGFKGTKHFESSEIVQYLESIGAVFGADINAHTSIDKTVYRLQIPLQNHEVLERGLRILNDWAFHMNITQDDVVSECSIIEEEWRSRQGSGQRLLDQYWTKIFADGGSVQYAKRMPIGLRKVFMNCSNDQLREFYTKWYRPEHMAVVAVGDFSNPQQVVSKIQEIFAIDLDPCTPLPLFPMPRHRNVVYCAQADSELTTTSVSIEFCEPTITSSSMSWLRREIIKRVFTSLVDKRLVMLCKRPENSNMLSAGISVRPLVPKLTSTSVSVQTVNSKVALVDALNLIIHELERISQFGFHQKEFENSKMKWKMSFASQLHNTRNTTNNAIVLEYLQHFMCHGEIVTSGETTELELSLELLNDLSLAEVCEFARKTLNMESDDPSQFIVVSTHQPTTKSSQVIDDTMLQSIYETAHEYSRQNVTPWEQQRQRSTVMLNRPNPGSIVSKQYMEQIDAVEYDLSNGIRICLKSTEFRKGSINFQAFALRGSSELTQEDEAAMMLLGTVAEDSGLGILDGHELSELQSQTHSRVNTQKHFYHRGLGGSCKTDSFELMLQMLHQKFMDQPFDHEALERHITRQKAMIAERENCPYEYFALKEQEILFGDHPCLRPLTETVLDGIDLSDLTRLHNDAFRRNPSEFTFVFVGDLPTDTDTVAALLETYLGSLAFQEEQNRHTFRPSGLPTPLPVVFPNQIIDVSIDRCVADKCYISLSYFVEISPENQSEMCLMYRSVAEIAQIRLLEVLRRQLGGVYNVSVAFSHFSLSEFGIIGIVFQCGLLKVDLIISTAVEELRKLALDGPSPQELATISEQHNVRQQVAIQNNSYWLFWILDSYKEQLQLGVENSASWVEQRVLNRSSSAIPAISCEIFTRPYVIVRLGPANTSC